MIDLCSGIWSNFVSKLSNLEIPEMRAIKSLHGNDAGWQTGKTQGPEPVVTSCAEQVAPLLLPRGPETHSSSNRAQQ